MDDFSRPDAVRKDDVVAPQSIARVTLTDQVRDYLVLEIAQGHLRPGDAVRELEIAARLGTSQSPVREALRELAALGLVETRRHVGARVRNMADQDLIDGVPVRAMLEGLAGRLAATAPPALKAQVREAFEVMLDRADTGDRLQYAAASTAFHRAVVHAARNESLQRAWNALGIEVMTIMATAASDTPLRAAAEFHRVIVEAVESGDPDVAEQVLREHQDHYLPATRRAEDSAETASA